MTTVLESIREWLTAEDVAYREVHHEPTRTSEDSARVRGEELKNGGKALVMKRFSARARGRVGRVEKPFSQLTVVVREREEQD